MNQEEIFIWNGIHIRQREDVFKIGTDALLLGAWVSRIIENPKKILDAGTGTGILALMSAQNFEDVQITAIDEDEASIALAEINFKNSIWSERLEARKANVLIVSTNEKNKYDLILSNPPFFYKQLEAESDVRFKAKHAQDSPGKWIKAMAGRLHPEGHICIIVPYSTAFEWITAANEEKMYCHHRMEVYSFRNDPYPTRSLLHFQGNLKLPEKTRLDIYAYPNQYTEEYLDFSKISQYPDHI